MSHQSMDPENQSDPMAAQELVISREKARRAREHFEREYEARIQRERREAGCCEMCGGPFSTLERFRRANKHRRCTTFTE